MKRLIFTFALIGAGLCSPAVHAAAQPECFASPRAVFSAHPNATHVSYSLRVKRSERCWYADAFRANAAPERPAVAAAPAQTSAPRRTATAPAPQQRTAAVAPPAPRSHTAAVVPAWQPPHVKAAPLSSRPAAVEFATEFQPLVARGLSRLLPVDESPTDFEGRFSATGYKKVAR